MIHLNAQQSTRHLAHPPPAEFFAETPSSNHESRIAETVINELAELRSQVQVRAKEDESLRNEIAMLRQQLADGRQSLDTPSKTLEKKSRKKTGILGFGKSAKATTKKSSKSDPLPNKVVVVEEEVTMPTGTPEGVKTPDHSSRGRHSSERSIQSLDRSISENIVFGRRFSGNYATTTERLRGDTPGRTPRRPSIDSVGSLDWSTDEGLLPLRDSRYSRRYSAASLSSMESGEDFLNETMDDVSPKDNSKDEQGKKGKKGRKFIQFGRKKKKKSNT